jgi:hypothetical protein
MEEYRMIAKNTKPPKYREIWLGKLMASSMTPAQKIVGERLSKHADWDSGERAHPGRELLAAEIGMSTDTVDRALKALCAAGWITRTVLSGGRRGYADAYALADPLNTTTPQIDPDHSANDPDHSATLRRHLSSTSLLSINPQEAKAPGDTFTSRPDQTPAKAGASSQEYVNRFWVDSQGNYERITRRPEKRDGEILVSLSAQQTAPMFPRDMDKQAAHEKRKVIFAGIFKRMYRDSLGAGNLDPSGTYQSSNGKAGSWDAYSG